MGKSKTIYLADDDADDRLLLIEAYASEPHHLFLCICPTEYCVKTYPCFFQRLGSRSENLPS